ncbi:hypothetical protein JK636_23070 [Clostridium sp. YIM B02515]|uniref:Platelet-activating factor acetylhydrolase n=1 Tax=Clostridium rhizosphaerae TaxID=2803861 RepID=A0ABS1TH02_9CLOT|nr:hypothetical protein [Clostridium rhizosphaerae]MBL4938590.1 hypothetical protein [Clostridium rhizosphaerae]
MRVGRAVRVLTDENREELLKNTGEKRKIIVSIFYPSDEDIKENQKGFYIDLFTPCEEEFIKKFAGKKNMAGQQVDETYLRSIKTNTFNNIEISKREILYPVVIFSPGLGMDKDCLIYNIEKLVSEGFIVFTLGHIYETDFTILPSGEVLNKIDRIDDFTFEEKEQLIEIRKEDILFLIEELKVLNSKDEMIKGKLDLDKIGIIGHSLGGSAVFNAAKEDIRIKAVVMLDGSLQHFDLVKDIEEGKRMTTPFLNFRRGSIDYNEEMKKTIEFNESRTDGEEFKKRIIGRNKTLIGQIEGQKQLYEYLSDYKSFIKLKHSEHLTFTDWPVIYNQEFENNILSIKEAHVIISEITVRFFKEFLCGMRGSYNEFIDSGRCPLICSINKNGEVVNIKGGAVC